MCKPSSYSHCPLSHEAMVESAQCIWSIHQVTTMVEFGKRLCSSAHYEQKDITTRQRAVLQRREKVKQSAVARRNRLEDCRKLMVFVQNCNEVSDYRISTVKQKVLEFRGGPGPSVMAGRACARRYWGMARGLLHLRLRTFSRTTEGWREVFYLRLRTFKIERDGCKPAKLTAAPAPGQVPRVARARTFRLSLLPFNCLAHQICSGRRTFVLHGKENPLSSKTTARVGVQHRASRSR